ncbi:MAG: DUF2288 domain-containing protein [Pseudomonadales bacterium]
MDQNKSTSIFDSETGQAKIYLETAKITWRELQRFFAAGKVYKVDASLDLTAVALSLSRDNRDFVQDLISQKKLTTVSDVQALRWYDEDILLWTVVVKPFVLVQEK